jgi:hypothetical protein
MSGFVIVVSPDAKVGYNSVTYQTEDDKLIAVVAMLTNPTPAPTPTPTLRQVFVMVGGLKLRGGTNTSAPVIRELAYGEVLNVYETITDSAGSEWARVGDNQWICRFIPGGSPPEKARWL